MSRSIDGHQPNSGAAPVDETQRIEAIDALRGLALFGVLLVNLVTEFRVSLFRQFLPHPPADGFANRFISTVVTSGLEMKAFSLFSLLFGVGLAIQFDRLAGRPSRAILLCRRLAALLAFGLIHLFLIWNGDILTEYAVCGFLVLPLLYASTDLVAAVAIEALVFYAAMPLLHLPIPFPSQQWMIHHVAEAASAFRHGDYSRVVSFNIAEVPSLVPLHLFVLPRTIGLFALGMWLWRVGVFERGLRPRALTAALIALPLGAVLTAEASAGAGPPVAPVLGQLAPVVLAIGYAGAILWLATGERSRILVMWAAPLGRMAFSNYIAQSVIFGFIFYGYGLGLFDRLAPFPTFCLGVMVYAAQVIVSRSWLRCFRFGPLEWLWRTLMYGRIQPMRRSSRISRDPPAVPAS